MMIINTGIHFYQSTRNKRFSVVKRDLHQLDLVTLTKVVADMSEKSRLEKTTRNLK